MFEIGDIVVGIHSGNHVLVKEVRIYGFSGTVIKTGKKNWAYSAGDFSDDWAIEMFRPLNEMEGFWDV